MTLNKEDMKALTDKYAKMCGENDTVEQNLFAEYGVKRGLRDINGKGVLTGITNISRVESTQIIDGKSVPCPGRLFYRGYNIKDLVNGFIAEDRFGFEETAYLLLFGKLPKKDEIVYLRENSNISTGGDSVDYTDDIPQKFKEIAVNAARAAGAKICGVDMMLEDYSDENTNYAIIELNFNPAIHIHSYPYKGKERNIAKHVLKLLELI